MLTPAEITTEIQTKTQNTFNLQLGKIKKLIRSSKKILYKQGFTHQPFLVLVYKLYGLNPQDIQKRNLIAFQQFLKTSLKQDQNKFAVSFYSNLVEINQLLLNQLQDSESSDQIQKGLQSKKSMLKLDEAFIPRISEKNLEIKVKIQEQFSNNSKKRNTFQYKKNKPKKVFYFKKQKTLCTQTKHKKDPPYQINKKTRSKSGKK